MKDVEKIKTKIGIIQENLEELKKLKEFKFEELSKNKRDLAACKYFIRSAIEAMIDIGSHIVAKELLGTPSTNVEIMLTLSNKGVLTEENLSTYVKMVKYRNRLTHFYQEVIPQEVFDILQNKLQDFELYIKDILNYFKQSNSI